MAIHGAGTSPADWHLWRFELTAYGEYVELSFEDVVLRTDADVRRWSRELATAFGHYGRPVDLVLDLRGLHLGGDCGRLFSQRFAYILSQHAAASAVYGSDEAIAAAIEPAVQAWPTAGQADDRVQALDWIFAQRKLRRTADTNSAVPTQRGASAGGASRDGRTWPRAWEQSGATNL